MATRAKSRKTRTPLRASGRAAPRRTSQRTAASDRRAFAPGGAPAGARFVRARYDAAQTTTENRRHWINSDACSADAANSAGVRKTLRERARYEIANNSRLKGMLLTLAGDLVGPGPRLQVRTGDEALNRRIEGEFSAWMRSVRLAAKLRTMVMAKAGDGEAFAFLAQNPVYPHPVSLDLALFEADRCTSEFAPLDQPVDGIILDEYGNPATYHILSMHPGNGWAAVQEPVSYPAAKVIHWFRQDRPEQHRGIPELTPALDLFADLRRYRAAVVAAAETAAEIAGVMKTTAPPEDGADELDPLTQIEIERRMLAALPMGWELQQLKAEQPATTYEMFTRCIVGEAARCILMPMAVALGDSSRFNYASGRLDHQTYDMALNIWRQDLAEAVLDRLLAEWLREAVRVPGLLDAPALADAMTVPHEWFWHRRRHVDPLKEAEADVKRVRAGLMTLADYWAAVGLDSEEQESQIAKEHQARIDAGLPQVLEDPSKAAAPSPPSPDGGGDEEDAAAVDEETADVA